MTGFVFNLKQMFCITDRTLPPLKRKGRHLTLGAALIQLYNARQCSSTRGREEKNQQQHGLASAIRKAAWTTKGPESTANMTPQGLIFLAGWDKMSIHYGINLHPNPLYPILPTLLLHPSFLHPHPSNRRPPPPSL